MTNGPLFKTQFSLLRYKRGKRRETAVDRPFAAMHEHFVLVSGPPVMHCHVPRSLEYVPGSVPASLGHVPQLSCSGLRPSNARNPGSPPLPHPFRTSHALGTLREASPGASLLHPPWRQFTARRCTRARTSREVMLTFTAARRFTRAHKWCEAILTRAAAPLPLPSQVRGDRWAGTGSTFRPKPGNNSLYISVLSRTRVAEEVGAAAGGNGAVQHSALPAAGGGEPAEQPACAPLSAIIHPYDVACRSPSPEPLPTAAADGGIGCCPALPQAGAMSAEESQHSTWLLDRRLPPPRGLSASDGCLVSWSRGSPPVDVVAAAETAEAALAAHWQRDEMIPADRVLLTLPARAGGTDAGVELCSSLQELLDLSGACERYIRGWLAHLESTAGR